MANPLFLDESALYQFFLNEDAVLMEADDEDTEDPQGSDKEKDAPDAGADTKDTEADAGDAPESDDTPPESDDDSEEEPSDESSDDESATPAPKKKPSRFAIKVDDTPQNRAFMFEKFEALNTMHQNLRQFIENIRDRANLSPAQEKIFSQLEIKIGSNIDLLKEMVDGEMLLEMEMSDIFGLYKIYFNDVSSVNKVIRSIMNTGQKDGKKRQPKRG